MSIHASPLHVLVVDDEPLICWSMAQTLEECGDVVREAGSADGALRALAMAPSPDVVLLDFHLPDSHDLDLLSTVRHLAPDSQVILMSANCPPDIAEHAIGLGAYRVIAKPIDMNDIPGLVHGARLGR